MKPHHPRIGRAGGVAIAAIALMTPLLVAVAPVDDEYADVTAAKQELHERLDPALVQLLEGDYSLSSGTGAETAPAPQAVLEAAAEGDVAVVIFAVDGEAEGIEADLLNSGYDDTQRVEQTVLARVSLTTLRELGDDERAARVTVAPQGHTTVQSQGVDVINADHWETNGARGQGVKVAIIDGGFSGYSALRGSELPSSVTTKDYCGSMGHPEKHGTAVAEIVHDVAPAAKLTLICIQDAVDFANAVDYAIANDIDIIQHSMGWVGADMRGDGTGYIADIAKSATNAGILWVNSAGNSAQTHWSGMFNDSDGDRWHNFSGSDEGNQLSIAPYATIGVHLRWADSFSSANDYDLWVFHNGAISTTNIDGSFASWNEQSGRTGDYPYEYVWVTNNSGSPVDVRLAIHAYNAPQSKQMDIMVLGGSSPLEYKTAAGSILEPGNVANVLTVGAHQHNVNTIESFSSQGPTSDGRVKPDITAPDGVSTVAYGANGFFGTSASAPHVSGAAALLWSSVYHKDLTANQLRNALKNDNITRSGLGGTFPNNVYGTGRLQLWNVPTPTFSDVGLANTFLFEVEWLNNQNITGGYPDGTFRGGDTVRRQAMAAFLYRFAGEPSPSGPVTSFTDVPSGHAFHTEVSWLSSSGVTEGYPDGSFRPMAQVPRMAMAAFLYRFAEVTSFTPPTTPTFPDVPTTHPFYTEIEWLSTTGITGGFADGKFKPSQNVSRQAMAAFLMRLDNYLG